MPSKNETKVQNNFKFKDMRVYASTDWLAGDVKKYRTVFENMEVSYLYVEFAFYNKFFDVKDWDIELVLRCFRVKSNAKNNTREEVCKINVKSKVSKDNNIVFIREGWGHQDLGGFWTKGDYIWEAVCEGSVIGSKTFYIENGGKVTADDNPYFEVEAIRLYEGVKEDTTPNIDNQEFYRVFKAEETRYIWSQLIIENCQNNDWFCEFTFNFCNSIGQLKGQTTELRRVGKEEDSVTITTGWGSDTSGSWHPGRYTLEVIFMDELVAVLPFEVGEDYVSGTNTMLTGSEIMDDIFAYDTVEQTTDTYKETVIKLEKLVGLKEVKKKVDDYTQYLKFLKIRKERSFKDEEPINLHAVFKGNPGTGKTTIANLLGKIYKKLGLLSRGKVLEVSRAELVGQYIGQTAPKVKETIEKARGGILFIDEAYSLIRNNEDSKDYGHEVIETLVKEMSDGKGDIAIVVAGYPAEMDIFLNSNPGLKSRFNIQIDFPDYLPQELSQIAKLAAEKHDVSFTKQAKKEFDLQITEHFRNRDKTFGNARLVYQMLEKAKMNMALRVMELENDQNRNLKNTEDNMLRQIELQDVRSIREKDKKQLPLIAIDEELLEEALDELNKLIGLDKVKQDILELVELVRFYKDTDRHILNRFSLHTIFKGNPGTGKTTIARLIAKIYKALGVLEKGHIVECDRQGLVAGYVGQTALKTQTKIEEAVGGVLFIDEAYALTSGQESNDFGKEAIEVILKQMEDKRGEFIVIVAGYPSNMDRFIEMNPGLKSRFDRTLIFEDFSVEELYKIAVMMFGDEKLKPDTQAAPYLKKRLKELHSRRDKYFGNARTVRKIVKEAIKKQHLRMASMTDKARNKKQLETLQEQDLQRVDFRDEDLTGKKQVGFRATGG